MPELRRHLGVTRAIVIGLASMTGAGVFFVWAPAADAAGTALIAALLVAAVVATLNALSTAQLAMAHPVSGGAYAYGRAELGPWWGFAAGWLFMTGKTGSAAAIALIAGSYLWPDDARIVAVTAVVVFAVINATGVRSTAAVASVVVAVVLGGLAFAIVSVIATRPLAAIEFGFDAGWYGTLQAAAMIFFAFAGYARMATLGEEVRDPRRTLPVAIVIALVITLIVYGTVGITVTAALGTEALAASESPLADALGGAWWVRALAGVACLGSLMSVLAGLSRTGLAMARARDLPGALARVSPRTNAPAVAEATVATLAVVAVLFLEPAQLIGVSSCAVLGYYSIAQLSALRQGGNDRWLPRVFSVIGLVGCLTLALTVPLPAIIATCAVLALGMVARAVRVARRGS